MTVFIHLNHGLDESYLLAFPSETKMGQIRAIIDSDFNKAVPLLMNKSAVKIQISARDRKGVRSSADFVLTEGCVTERLA